MLIATDTGTLEIVVTWREPDAVELAITETVGGTQHFHTPRYLSPEQLGALADYINRTLCR
jgi:hypothetical protein